MARLIIAATPVYGHFAPLRAIAVDLVRRGHDVTFLTGSIFREALDGTGARFAALQGGADHDSSWRAELRPERESIPPGPERIDFDLRRLFTDPIPDQHCSLQALLAEAGDEPVVVLHDTTFLGSWPVLLGAPGSQPTAVIGLGITVVPISSMDTAPFGLGLPPDSSEEGRARNREANAFAQGQLLAGAQAHLVEVLNSLGTTEAPPFIIDGWVSVPDRNLQLSIAGLEYSRSDAPASLRFVGALPPETQHQQSAHQQSALPEWWDEVVTAKKVVVVSQGTIANQDFSALIEPTLRALADLDALVVATLGRAAPLSDVPANARVAEFIPFDRLLAHTDVLVSNGGFGGVQQALTHGIPMVLAGQTEDKMEVAARAAWTGSAINLATQRPDEPEIRKAVESVLGIPSYREHALRLQAEYARHDALAEIAETIEELLLERWAIPAGH